MKKAIPAIAVSAVGVTWLLHAQGVIDASTARAGSPAGSGSTATGTPTPSPTPTTTSPRILGGDDDDEGRGPVTTRRSPTTTAGPTTTVPSARGGGSRTVDGSTVNTRFGPVQVQVLLEGSKITDVKVLQYPDEARRSQAINAQALPMLHDQAVAAQSAQIDGVSGATYTSTGYQESLQAALDSAR